MAYITDKQTGKAKYIPDSQLKPTPADTVSNTSSAPVSKPAAATVSRTPKQNVYTSDNLRVRDSLNALGYDNDKIGWDGKNVTYDGQYLLTPEINDDGVTKTTTNNFIQHVNNNYKTRGIDDSVVDVTAYAAGATKLPNAVTHESGVVSLGGIPIQNTIIIDGVAYAPRSSIDAAVTAFQKNTGPYTKKANEYLDSTASKAKTFEESVANYGPFSYNPETDPAYIAYRDAYTRNAKRALEDTYAENAARTGGYANSAAISASNQAYYNHMSELADRIPQLMDNAYDRYLSDFDILLDGLEMYGTPYDRHLLESDAFKLDMDAEAKALEADYARDMYTKNFNYGVLLDNREYDSYLRELENMSPYEIALMIEELRNRRLKNDALEKELESM